MAVWSCRSIPIDRERKVTLANTNWLLLVKIGNRPSGFRSILYKLRSDSWTVLDYASAMVVGGQYLGYMSISITKIPQENAVQRSSRLENNVEKQSSTSNPIVRCRYFRFTGLKLPSIYNTDFELLLTHEKFKSNSLPLVYHFGNLSPYDMDPEDEAYQYLCHKPEQASLCHRPTSN